MSGSLRRSHDEQVQGAQIYLMEEDKKEDTELDLESFPLLRLDQIPRFSRRVLLDAIEQLGKLMDVMDSSSRHLKSYMQKQYDTMKHEIEKRSRRRSRVKSHKVPSTEEKIVLHSFVVSSAPKEDEKQMRKIMKRKRELRREQCERERLSRRNAEEERKRETLRRRAEIREKHNRDLRERRRFLLEKCMSKIDSRLQTIVSVHGNHVLKRHPLHPFVLPMTGRGGNRIVFRVRKRKKMCSLLPMNTVVLLIIGSVL